MKMKTLYPFLLAALFLSACENKVPSNEVTPQADGIRGGIEVEASDPLSRMVFRLVVGHSRYMKKLDDGTEREALRSSNCTASALTNRVLITAAHCFPELTERGHVEIINSDNTLTQIPMVEYKIHPLYKDDRTTDLAMVLLEHSLPEEAQFVTLPTKSFNQEFTKIRAAGYGVLGTLANPSGAGVLRTVELDVIQYDKYDEEMLTDQSQGKGACKGDSGSSALLKVGDENVVIGILSQSIFKVKKDQDPNTIEKCAFKGRFVNVQPQLDWIHSTLKYFANH